MIFFYLFQPLKEEEEEDSLLFKCTSSVSSIVQANKEKLVALVVNPAVSSFAQAKKGRKKKHFYFWIIPQKKINKIIGEKLLSKFTFALQCRQN